MASTNLLEIKYPDGAAAFLAAARLVRIAGDKTLERAARRELVTRYSINLIFRSQRKFGTGRGTR